MSFFIFVNQERLREENCAVKEFMSPPLLFSLFVHPPKYVLIIWFSIFCARPPTTWEITNAQRKSRKEYWREGNCAIKRVFLPLSLQYSCLISSHIISFGLLVHPPDWIKMSTWFSPFSVHPDFSLPLYSSHVSSLMLSYCFNFPVLVLSSSAWCANLDSNEGLFTQSSLMRTILKVSFGNTRLASVWNITECEHPGRILAFWNIGL